MTERKTDAILADAKLKLLPEKFSEFDLYMKHYQDLTGNIAETVTVANYPAWCRLASFLEREMFIIFPEIPPPIERQHRVSFARMQEDYAKGC